MRRYRSIADRKVAQACLPGVGAVLHAASLHKPHVGCNDRQAFIDTNIAGTLVLLEEAAGWRRNLPRLREFNATRLWRQGR
jgi:nucleoside-diphosphate-sugar epimerase